MNNFKFQISNFKLIFTLLLFNLNLSAQVKTRILGKEQLLENLIPYHLENEPINFIDLPNVDIEAVLEEDKARKEPFNRFGIGIKVNYSEEDGPVHQMGEYTVWRMAFQSDNAASLNLQFKDVDFPEGTMMYIFNREATMIIGPVEPQHIFERRYSSDGLYGDNAIVKVLIPTRSFEQFNISLFSITHGIKKTEDRAFGDSGACQRDVNCSTVPSGWTKEKNATLLIYLSDGGSLAAWCSGVLLNAPCQDIRGFVLTANHCYSNTGGQYPLVDWVFRFNYDSPDPVAPSCQGSEPTEWLTYSGAVFRALNAASDFFLAEFFGSLTNQPTIGLAGWDRTPPPPLPKLPISVIHHPGGDVKKFSMTVNSNTPAVFSSTPTIPGLSAWKLTSAGWSFGSIEPGSSGSALFNSDRRVIGQTYGYEDSSNPIPCPPNFSALWGRFDASWTGGGTSTSRLSSWLGDASAPMTTNSITPPSIYGNNTVCSSSNTPFSLSNAMPNRTITWAVTPASLVTVASGSGINAIFKAKTSSSQGLATITYTLAPTSGSGCFNVVVSKQIWIGKPLFSISGPTTMCINNYTTLSLTGTLASQQYATTTWTYGGPLTSLTGYETYAHITTGGSTGAAFVIPSMQNSCGTTSVTHGINVNNCVTGGGITLKTMPNPTNDWLYIEIQSNDSNLLNTYESRASIYNMTGTMLRSHDFSSNFASLNIKDLDPGLYSVEVTTPKGTAVKQFMVIQK